jgi:hypothetical protein
LVAGVVCLGFFIDKRLYLTSSDLEFIFHLAGAIAIIPALVVALLSSQSNVKRLFLVLLAVVIWRISFFPILVISAYVATLSENFFSSQLDLLVIYPAFLASIFLLNLISFRIGILVLNVLIRLVQGKSQTVGSYITTVAAIPLAVIAGMVSFTEASDLHAMPVCPITTSVSKLYADDAESLLQTDPYHEKLQAPDISWRKKPLLYAASVTYDLIPEGGVWTQAVKSNLELKTRARANINNSQCMRNHLDSFILAHKALHKPS